MKRTLLSLLLLSLAFACSDDDGCLSGNVIGSETCTGFTLIAVNDLPIGRSVDYGEIHYKNAIKVPGSYPLGPIYFNLKDYNQSTDAPIVLEFCLAMYSPYDVPVFTLTSSSVTGCP